jgi:Ca-activated chloride channel homolog
MLRRLLFFVLVFAGLGLTTTAQEPPLPWQPWNVAIDYHRVNVTVRDQIATTAIDMQFTNDGEGLAEGTFIFPLPEGAAVDELIMYVDGQAIESKILPAGEARAIYDEIVRQYRDPALLEYIGTSAIQANVFPIPAGESRRIEIRYGQVLEVDNSLLHYIYPMHPALNDRPIGQMSVSVDVESDDPISNIYSPSHPIVVSRGADEGNFRVGYEATNFIPGEDFSLFYGIASETINVNLLTYRESANEDGFFMLLVQPPLTVDNDRVIPKDVIVVLDQSGSMDGAKWDQARTATSYVLENLNPADRFNMVVFSTGARVYANEMQPVGEADEASAWINNMFAEGGTDINLALTTALDMADPNRTTTILFLTDGLATEGTVETDAILANVEARANDKTRIFTFGVGDDVDTFLLDRLFQNFRGAGSYVRPSERIDEEVAGLYNKISAPVLTDTILDFDGALVELLYPQTLPDLFAGEQLTLVGRYRDGVENLTLTLSGTIEDEAVRYSYDGLDLRDNAGGEAFIARLWAQRRIGDLLNTIRLNGENEELVDSVVSLSVRYGIITPYTSFLIEEDDILTQQGRERAQMDFEVEAQTLNQTTTGSGAVDAADEINRMNQAEAPMSPAPTMLAPDRSTVDGEAFPEMTEEMDMGEAVGGMQNALNNVNNKTFVNLDGVWNDTTFDPDTMQTNQVTFLSDEYFDLLDEYPELGDYFALGERVIVVLDGVVWEVVPEA